MAFQLFQRLVVIVSYHTELKIEVTQLGIVLMLAPVECNNMERLTENSCFDEGRLACHS